MAHLGLLVSPDDIPEAAKALADDGEATYRGYSVRRESTTRLIVVLSTVRTSTNDVLTTRSRRLPDADGVAIETFKKTMGSLFHPDNFVIAAEIWSF